jgi:hypothetical protein
VIRVGEMLAIGRDLPKDPGRSWVDALWTSFEDHTRAITVREPAIYPIQPPIGMMYPWQRWKALASEAMSCKLVCDEKGDREVSSH